MLIGRRSPVGASLALSLVMWVLCAVVVAPSAAYAHDEQTYTYDAGLSDAAYAVRSVGAPSTIIFFTDAVDVDLASASLDYFDATNTADDLLVRLSYSDKIRGQMGPRGWTDDLVEETIGSPARRETVWDLTSGSQEAATAFVRSDGTYVVVNDASGLIVQVSDRLNPNWKPVWNDPRFQR